MEPTFADGALVLIEPVGVRRFGDLDASEIVADEVVVARHPFKNLDVIKFVAEVHDDGYVSLRSPSGDDSRNFGRVIANSVKGRVTANLSERSLVS